MPGSSKSPSQIEKAARKSAKKAAKRAAKKRKLESGSSMDESKESTVNSDSASSPVTVFGNMDAAGSVSASVGVDAAGSVSESGDMDAESVIDDMPDNDVEKFHRFIVNNREDILSMLTETTRWKEEMSFAADFSNGNETLKAENESLRKKLAIAEGRINRLEHQVEILTTKTTDLTVRSMRDNILIKNMDEEKDEKPFRIIQKVKAYFSKELKIQETDLEGIDIERCHRLGKFVQGKVRNIVLKLNSKGKDIITSHWQNLRSNCPIKISDQYPPEIHAKRDKLWPVFSQAKTEGKKPKWIRDQLLVDGKVLTATQDKVTDINMDIADAAAQMKTQHNAVTTKDGNHFQAHSVPIKSKDDVIPAVKALCADSRVSGAAHAMYAYRVGTERYSVHNWEDDGKWGAGRWIMSALTERGVYNQLICITRWHSGKNLGNVRFEVIKQLANEAITAIK